MHLGLSCNYTYISLQTDPAQKAGSSFSNFYKTAWIYGYPFVYSSVERNKETKEQNVL
jgi:hypothetical protein